MKTTWSTWLFVPLVIVVCAVVDVVHRNADAIDGYVRDRLATAKPIDPGACRCVVRGSADDVTFDLELMEATGTAATSQRMRLPARAACGPIELEARVVSP